MTLPGCLVDDPTSLEDGLGATLVAIERRLETDAAVAGLVVIPNGESFDPQPRLVDTL